MIVRQNDGRYLLWGLLLGSLVCGCGASGSSTRAIGGQVGAGGNPATGGAPDATGGIAGNDGGSSATGGAGANTGGNSPTGGSKATGGSSASTGGRATGGTPTTGGTPPVTCNSNVTSTGCTPGSMTQTGTLASRYGNLTATIGSKQYYFQVNEWNTSATQVMSYGGSYFFKMTQQTASAPSNGSPTGFPSIFIGANSGHSTSGSGMPKQVSSLGTVLTTWNWNDNGTSADTTNNIFNATYDVWFSTNSGGDPSQGFPSGGFLMVWYYAQGCTPMGGIQDAGHTIDGIAGCWDVWLGTNNGKPVISYKRQGMVKSMGFDLNLFIKDALKNYPTYMNSNWYLTNIFTGFEIWKGGVNLESTSFCAEVN